MPPACEAARPRACAARLPRYFVRGGIAPCSPSAQQLDLSSHRCDEFVIDGEVADLCHDLSVLHADIADQQPLAVRDAPLCRLSALFCHGDAPGLPEQLQGPLHLDPTLAVGPTGFKLLHERHRRIGTEIRLNPLPVGRIQRRSCRAKRWLLRERARDGLRERQTGFGIEIL